MNAHVIDVFLVQHALLLQVGLFALTLLTLWSAEIFWGRESVREKWARARFNGLFVMTAIPLQIPLVMMSAAAALWVTAHRWGLVFLLPGADNPWIKYGLMFVVLDFLDYVYHVTMHKAAGLWRYHLVHHTDLAVDVSTTVREHPGETVLRNLFLTGWVLLCGASLEILVMRQTLETVSNIISHTALRLPRLPARWLGWLLITPNLHHVHHHFRLPATNCNYGDVFSIWDRLFGTFREELPEGQPVFGLDTHMARMPGAGFTRVLMFPFDTASDAPTVGA